MDIMMVEQAQMGPSCKRPAEKPAGSRNEQGFGRHMDSALGDGERHGVEKAVPAGVDGTQSSDVAYDSEVSDPSQAQPTQPSMMKEAALSAGEEDLQPASVEEYPGEAGLVPNPYALDAFLIPAFQQFPVKSMASGIGVDPASIVSSEGMPDSGSLIEASGVAQYISIMAQNNVQAGIDGTEPGLKAGEAIVDQGPGEIDIDDLAGDFESTGSTGLQTGLEDSIKAPIAAETSFEKIPGLTTESQADRTISGLSDEAGVEGFSLEGLAEDVEMTRGEISVDGDIEGSGASAERDGFQPGNSGKEGNSDPSFGSGAQAVAQMEARTAGGFPFSIDQTDQIGASQSLRTAESSIVETEVLDRFGEGVRLSVSNGMKEVRINMHPEELGGVTIRLRVDNGTVSAHVLVDSQSVKGIFDSDTGRLRDVFAQNGLVLDRFSVELSPGQGDTGGSSGGQSHRWSGETTPHPRFAYQEAASLDSNRGAQSLTGINRSDNGIDLFA